MSDNAVLDPCVVDEHLIRDANAVLEKITVADAPLTLLRSIAPNMNLLSENQSSTPRGLILSVDNIKHIKQYVAYGKSLICDAQQLQSTMKYPADFDAKKYPNLAPEAVASLYHNIQVHCEEWSDLEANIKRQGAGLEGYATDFLTTGSIVLQSINQLPLLAKLKTTLEQFCQLDTTQYTIQGEDDKEILVGIGALLDRLKQDAESRLAATQTLSDRLGNYRKQLDNELLSQLARMKSDIDALMASDQRADLLKQVKALDDEIDSLSKQYDKLVGYSFTGSAGMVLPPLGVISWAITGGYFGAKAEKIRKKRNQRSTERDAISAALAKEDALAGMVAQAASQSDLAKTVLYDALTGIKNLEALWACILQYIEDAKKQLDQVDTIRSLLIFQNNFQTAMAAWSEVRGITKSMVDVFQQAEAELNETSAGC